MKRDPIGFSVIFVIFWQQSLMKEFTRSIAGSEILSCLSLIESTDFERSNNEQATNLLV